MTALNIIVIANYPLEKHYILASLVKGRWIDGKAQALILLLSACDMPNIFMLQTFLPSRRRDCLISTASPYNTLFQNRTIPCFALSHLPPLSKGGGLTARHKLLIYCVCLQYIRLFILQAFLPSRRRDCHATLACINPSKTALSFEKHYILARPRKRG